MSSGLLRKLFTKEVDLVHFSDGDVFIVGGKQPVPAKPEGVVAERIKGRVWRWRRV